DRRAHRALRQAGRPRQRHRRRRLRLLLAGLVSHRGASHRGLGKIQGLTSGRGLGDEDAVEMTPSLRAIGSGPKWPARRQAPRSNPARRFSLDCFVAALLAMTWLLAAPARAADSVANFYRGKQIRFIVGSAAGGTYDLLARIVARHMPAHIPGSPSIIVQNQPTAGGILMVNQLYALGPNDGTAIGVPLNGIPAAPLLQPAAARFDASKLIWLGSTHSEPYVAYVWHTAPAQNLADVMSKELVVGATTTGTAMSGVPQLTNAVLGTKFKIVPGYASTPQMNEALERGEVEGVAGFGWFALNAQVPQWVTEKKITIIAQFGAARHRLLPDVPLMIDLAKSDADRRALLLLFGRTEYGRPYFLPPDVPAERV